MHNLSTLPSSEQFCDILGEVREHEIWPNVGEWLQYKTTSRDPRVREGNVGFGKCNIVIIEEIEVDYSRAVPFRGRRPAKGKFDVLELVEQFLRLQQRGKLKHSIEKGRRFGWTVERRSFVDFRAEDRFYSGVKAE